MSTFSANPNNFGALLQMVRGGDAIALTAGNIRNSLLFNQRSHNVQLEETCRVQKKCLLRS
ncbi:MAG TPA: hypothetical protein VK211_11045 [Kamptonema sp.]|nr:hypothetical protein [Kamptonema sp.]